MGYEVDFLGVGKESSKSGDAICIRFGNLTGLREQQTVVVIDGGFQETGAEVVEHVRTHFGTDRVDLVISTHPDQDHINGLATVIEELEVGELWIHKPWDHNVGLADKFHDGRITDNSITERLKKNLEAACALTKAAENKGITVREPFTGLSFAGGAVKVLGPSLSYYEELIPEFDGMPKVKVEKSLLELAVVAFREAARAVKRVLAEWGVDKHLDDQDTTSAKNNSSVITQIIEGDRRLVFTGDAGVTALGYAADELERCQIPAPLCFFQIPHHGSRRNVGPTVLNRIIGEAVAEGAPAGSRLWPQQLETVSPKHPRISVLNALTHRGAKVLVTRGKGICSSFQAQARKGWVSIEAEPYRWDYEEEET